LPKRDPEVAALQREFSILLNRLASFYASHPELDETPERLVYLEAARQTRQHLTLDTFHMLKEAASAYVSLAAEPELQPDRKHGQGFASMSSEKKREIASKGGRASAAGKGHKWSREEARWAGRQGGRPLALDDTQIALASQLYEEKRLTVQELCQLLGISKSTLYTYLRQSNR